MSSFTPDEQQDEQRLAIERLVAALPPPTQDDSRAIGRWLRRVRARRSAG